MNKLLRKCISCGTYTFKEDCPSCHSKTASPHPPRFSPDDKYARLRIADRYKSPEG